MDLDLAEGLDDLICTLDKAVNSSSSDILVAIFWWLVFAATTLIAVGYIIHSLKESGPPDKDESTADTIINDDRTSNGINGDLRTSVSDANGKDAQVLSSVSEKILRNLISPEVISDAKIANTSEQIKVAETVKTSFAALDPPSFSKSKKENIDILATNATQKLSVKEEILEDSITNPHILEAPDDSVMNNVGE